jgi:hypothetical protein
MPANIQPIFPISPVIGIGDTIATLTSRAKITGTTGLTACTPTSTNGKRIDSIVVQLAASSAAAVILIFIYDGTTSFLFDEIAVAAVTAGNTVPAFRVEKFYNNLVLPPTYRIYAATTIAQNTNVFVHGGDY